MALRGDYSNGKVCAGCKKKKPVSEFGWRKDRNSYRSYCASCTAIRARTWHRKKGKSNGISGEEYAQMFASQGGVCAICKNPETKRTHDGEVQHLVVDHCHTTGKTRGLLCNACNLCIGYARDDARRLRAAAAYVEMEVMTYRS